MQSYQTTEDLAVIQDTGERLKRCIQDTIESISVLYETGQDVSVPLDTMREAISAIAKYTPTSVWRMYQFVDHRISHERDRAIARLYSKIELIDKTISGLTDVKPKRQYTRRIYRTSFWHPEENRKAVAKTVTTQVTVDINWDKVRRATFHSVYRNFVKRSRLAQSA